MNDADNPARALVGKTTRLVEFLRDLASAGRPRIRDLERYEQVLWLADLPLGVVPDCDAAPGEVLLTLEPEPYQGPPPPPELLTGWLERRAVDDPEQDPLPILAQGPVAVPEQDPDGTVRAVRTTVPLAQAPEVAAAYRGYLVGWQAWAAAERARLPRRRWYEQLSRLAHQLSQQDDQYELVVGAGLLSWHTPSGQLVRNHLFSTRVLVGIDPDTGTAEVRLPDEGSTRVQDRDLLDGEQGFHAARADTVRTQLQERLGAPLAEDVVALLDQWRTLALDRCPPCQPDWSPGTAADATISLRLAPALVLRPRDRANLINYYDRMLEALAGPDAVAPLGLAQLVSALEPEQRLSWLDEQGAASGEAIGADPLFPLPSNPEQRQIIGRLRTDNGVVVQGPPGTGKTHTIANLTAALLAQGQRVLVTSQKAQALRVLRDKLPEQVQSLCVSMTDLGRGGSNELSRSVNSLSERFSSFEPTAHGAQTAALAARRDEALRRRALLGEQMRAVREAQTYQHPAVAPGYAGTLSAIAALLRQGAAHSQWLPTPLPDAAADLPPLSIEQVAQLRALLCSATPQRRARTAQQLPALDTLPATGHLEALVAAEVAAAAAATEVETELSRQLAALGADVLATLEQAARQGRAAWASLRLGADPDGWDPTDWRVRALGDLLAGREAAAWQQLAEVAAEVLTVREELNGLGLREVTLPVFEAAGPASAQGQLAAGRALHAHLAAGNPLRRGPLRRAVQRAADPLLDALVDGVPVSNAELLEVVLSRLHCQVVTDALAARWRAFGVTVDPQLPLERRVAQLVDHHDDLEAVVAAGAARDQVLRLLGAAHLDLALGTPAEWLTFVAALGAVRARVQAQQATAELETTAATLDRQARARTAPPELAALRASVARRDVAAYQQTLHALAEAHTEQLDQAHCEQLWEVLHTAHPGLAQLLERTCQDPEWETRLASLPAAWAWAKAKTFFDAQREPGREQRLDAELADATARVEQITAELAAAQAWGHCLSRMTAHQAQALRAYQAAMTDRGKGTGRYAHKFEQAAREAMVEARAAVPAWIMPLPEVLETMPPDRDSFDVVIVDEASQASIESLFLLWLAPRVIVVGDDRQCTPSQVSHGELQPIFDKLDSYLPDLPGYLRIAFTPKSSLFSLLATRFSSVIRLREHFRCMPEIIDWSSRQFYSDAPLVPLRQFGADRLAPLQTRYVAGAVTEGTATRLRNTAEAEAVVAQIVACLADRRYDGLTFGVVVLQGTGQVQLLETLLAKAVRPEEAERRRLRVGSPPDFQGDERHVMFLSMVVAERRSAVTAMEWQRRFNVAASRAQDQMWLFHSVTADLLSPTDLRRSLLSYLANPPAPLAQQALGEVTPDEPHPAFDSLFEQRVFLRIRAAGYHVTPQVEVNGRRIDMVVTGLKGRLAVECDGPHHLAPAQVLDDLDRENELKRAGWRFWRLPASEFDFDPDAALASLWETLDRRGIHPHEVPVDEHGAPTGEWAAQLLSTEDGLDGLDGADPRELDELAVPALARPRAVPASRPAAAVPADGFAATPEVRQWARSHGVPVGERGRLHPDVIAAYNAQHPDRPYR